MDDYLSEINDIQVSHEDCTCKDDLLDINDNKNIRSQTLSTLGLENVAKQLDNGETVNENQVFFTYSRRYSQLLAQEINSFRIGSKQCKPAYKDVRDVFPENASSDNESPGKSKAKFNPLTLLRRSISFGEQNLASGHKRTFSENCSALLAEESQSAEYSSELDEVDSMQTFQIIKDSSCKASDDGIFPSFTLIPGVNRIIDVTPADIDEMAKYAFLDVRSMTKQTVSLIRRKTKKKYKESSIFGVPVDLLYEADKKRYPFCEVKLPVFLAKLVDHLYKTGLSVQGILRVSASQAKVKYLCKDYEDKFSKNPATIDFSSVEPIVATGILKKFLRELPIPLLHWDFQTVYEPLLDFKLEEQIFYLQCVVLNLPEAFRNSLKVVLNFLSEVVKNQSQNLMTLANVSMILAPNLFPIHPVSSKSKLRFPQEDAFTPKTAEGMSKVVGLMIHFQKAIWTIPTKIITTIKQDHEKQRSKIKDSSNLMLGDSEPVMMKYHFRNDKKYTVTQMSSDTPITPASEQCILVQRPELSKSSVKVYITTDTTASDVISEYLKRKERGASALGDSASNDGKLCETLQLYEVGGNLIERCLHPDFKMLPILQTNKNAQWHIKSPPDYSLHRRTLDLLNKEQFSLSGGSSQLKS